MRKRKGAHNLTGAFGEIVARNWLKNKGFSVIADNYQKPWGEIDLVVKKGQTVHFVEVKTVSYRNKADLERKNTWKPEDNVHTHKLEKISRVVDSWLQENDWKGEWQIDVAAVKLVPSEKYATIKMIENVILQ